MIFHFQQRIIIFIEPTTQFGVFDVAGLFELNINPFIIWPHVFQIGFPARHRWKVCIVQIHNPSIHHQHHMKAPSLLSVTCQSGLNKLTNRVPLSDVHTLSRNTFINQRHHSLDHPVGVVRTYQRPVLGGPGQQQLVLQCVFQAQALLCHICYRRQVKTESEKYEAKDWRKAPGHHAQFLQFPGKINSNLLEFNGKKNGLSCGKAVFGR